LLNPAIWLLARALNMPEPLVRGTGLFVFVHVQAVENSVGRTLRPIRLRRLLRSWFGLIVRSIRHREQRTR
jgi:hypothetical protein